MRTRILPCLALCAIAPAALAQVSIPPGLEPGQIQRQLEELRMPRATPEAVAPPAPEQIPPEQASQLLFVLRSVHVSGATVYPAAELEKAFQPLIGQEISVARIFQGANELTARYRGDGYILSQVLVPAQSIEDGRVQLLAIEGYVAQVRFQGDPDASDQLLASYGAQIGRARPLTAKVLERWLLLMNDLGHSTARGTLVPATDSPGASDLIVDFRRTHAATAAAVNNRSSRSLGPFRLSSDQDWYGALGTWNHIGLRQGSSLSQELNYLGAQFGSPIGHTGARWHFESTYVRANPGRAANLTTSDLKTRSLASVLQIDYPLQRSRTQNLYLRAALTSFDGQSEFALADLSNDRIRALRLGAALDYADRLRGIDSFDLELSHGLGGLGAREEGTADSPLSRLGGKADFSKVTIYASRLQSLTRKWSLLLAASAQHSFTTLLSPEQFGFGGDVFGRGYDAAEMVGDDGAAAKAELRFSGWNPQRTLGAYSFYGFYDWGRVQRRLALNQPKHESASSCGAGVRVTGDRGLWQAFLEVTAPLDHDVAAIGNRDARLFFGLQVTP